MKRCPKCDQTKPVAEFNRYAKSRDGLQPYCRACQQAWYAANKDQHLANVRRNKRGYAKVAQTWVLDYLAEHPCVVCGEKDPVVLTFDHRDGVDKLAHVSRLVAGGWSLAVIAAEVQKCDVRCANCHLRRTAEQFGFYAFVAQLDRAPAF